MEEGTKCSSILIFYIASLNGMKLNDLRMTGNVYNRVDADTWMTVPRLADTPVTSFLDVNKLVLFDPALTEMDEENYTADLLEFFRRFDD